MGTDRLNVGDFGDDVARLQADLKKCGYKVSAEEIKRKFFGPTTREAVGEFQKAHSIEPSFEVCEATASLLAIQPITKALADPGNISPTDKTKTLKVSPETVTLTGKALRPPISSVGMPSIPDEPGTGSAAGQYHLEGQIFLDSGLPAQGITLRLYSHGFGGAEALLGESKTDPQGGYVLSYDPGGKAANIEVRCVDTQGKEIALSYTKFNAEKGEVLNLVAPAAVQPLAPEFQRLSADLIQQVGNLEKLADAQEHEERQDLTLLHQATGWDARLIALCALAVKRCSETGIPQGSLYGLFRAGLPTEKQKLALVSSEAVEKALKKTREVGIINLNDEQVTASRLAFENFARQTRLAAKAPGALSSFGSLLERSGLQATEQNSFADLYFSHRDSPAELWQKAEKMGISKAKVDGLRLQGKLAYLTLNNAELSALLQAEISSLENLGQLVDKGFHKAATWRERLTTLAGNDEERLDQLIPPTYAGETLSERLETCVTDLARQVRRSFPTRVVAQMVMEEEIRPGGNPIENIKDRVHTFLTKAEALGFELGQVPAGQFIAIHREKLFPGGTSVEEQKEIETRVEQLQRLYQLTPSDGALQVLDKLDLSSAHDITAFTYEAFMEVFAADFPSRLEQELVYRKAQQIEAVTFNLVTMARQMATAPPLYATFPAPASPPETRREQAKANLIKHYPSLETLFGSLDFCECEHCRSVLSPAAYLVDLLHFLDPDPKDWKKFVDRWREKHNDVPYPFKDKADVERWENEHGIEYDPNKMMPYNILTARRPDLPYLPLTCENTHTALPYIDLVNEILEFYVANNELTDQVAHDTGEAATPELLSEPQNIEPKAYEKLKKACYPLELPFDLWLESVRRFFDHFETPLWQVLETLRSTDELFSANGQAAEKTSYYQAAIFAEQLGISPAEYQLFTDFKPQEWYKLYGYPDKDRALTTTKDDDGQYIGLHSAKTLARRLGVSYLELVDIVQTSFVNPELEALSIVWKLRLDVGDVANYVKNKGMPDYAAEQTAFEIRLEALLKELFRDLNDEAILVKFNELQGQLSSLKDKFETTLLLRDKSGRCNFDETYLEYADPASSAKPLDFLKINLFVRLWKKLGWTITETDRALRVFMPQSLWPVTEENLGTSIQTALVYLAHLKALDEQVKVGKNSRQKLLTLWANIATTGKHSLYAQLFLTKSVLKNDLIFDDPMGRYLCYFDAGEKTYKPFHWDDQQSEDVKTGNVSLKSHLLALQGALNLTADEIRRILAEAGQSLDKAALNLDTISLLYRYGLLAKALKSSVQDLIALIMLSGLNPCAALKQHPLSDYPRNDDKLSPLVADHPYSQTLRFIEIVDKVKASDFKVEDLNYLLRHSFDPVGTYRPTAEVPLALVKSLAAGIQRIQTENAVSADPAALTSDVLRQHLALVLPAEVADQLFSRLTGTAEFEVTQEKVKAIDRIDPKAFSQAPALRVSHDTVREIQHLVYRGLLTDAHKAQLKAAHPSQLLTKLLDEVQVKARESIVDQLQTALALLIGTTEFRASQGNIKAANQLDPKAFAQEPAVRVSYDKENETQYLAYRGLLSNVHKAQLEAADTSPVLAKLLDKVQAQTSAVATNLIVACIGMLSAEVAFTASQQNVEPEDQLKQTDFTHEPALQVDYNKESKTQRLSYRGFLNDKKKTQLKAQNTSSVLANLIDKVQGQAKGFISDLRVDFLTKTDFDPIFANLDGVTNNSDKARGQLARVIMPFLQKKLIHQLIGQTLATDLSAAPALVEALLVEARLLTDPSQPGDALVDAIAGVSENGTTVTFYDSPDGEGNPSAAIVTGASPDTGVRDTSNQRLMPDGAKSAHFAGYLQVPYSGAYRFFAVFDKQGPIAELRFAHLPEPVLQGQAAKDGAEISQFVDLKQGVPYYFTLTVHNLGVQEIDGNHRGDVKLLVQGENLPKGELSRVTLYPHAVVERFHRVYLLISKTLQLIQGLEIDEREVRYLLTHPDDFNNLNLSQLPTRATDDSLARARGLFHQFLRLIDYAHLKQALDVDTDDLVAVFENARCLHRKITDVDQAKTAHFERLARLTRRTASTVRSTAEILGFTVDITPNGSDYQIKTPDLAQEKGISRLWDALQIVEKLGIPADQVICATRIITDTQIHHTIAQNLRNTVKARYEPEAWQRIAPPIFDKLRQRQRDALVAYVLHNHPEKFKSANELFEYYLIDPGMEPIVQTSRIRLAISSVQLFVQRCLLNLEPHVAPSTINSQHWRWMKNYRVWEANRKIFLFPENWLEPEFRDDKTHLFQELESALLQGDVSNDLAEVAFFNYLKKLEELARLEIVTMYLDEESGTGSDDILHVIGRTHNQPHKYFYRRYAHHMWTPWEPVTVEIEGDHVVAVVWRERLHLFWVTFLEKAEKPTKAPQKSIDKEDPLWNRKLGSVVNQISGSTRTKVEVQLNWSEHFQGQWTTRESSGFPNPVWNWANGEFERNAEFIHVTHAKDDSLLIHLFGTINGSFRVVSKNSRPEPEYLYNKHQISMLSSTKLQKPYLTNRVATTHCAGSGSLKVTFTEVIGSANGEPRDILLQSEDFSLLRTSNLLEAVSNDISALSNCFFYQDKHHTFFVEPTVSETTVKQYTGFGIGVWQPGLHLEDEDWWEKRIPIQPKAALIDVDPGWIDPIDPLAKYKIQPEADWISNPETVLQFDQSLVGPGGRMEMTMLLGTSDLSEIGLVSNILPADDQAPGAVTVPYSGAGSSLATTTLPSVGLNVIGGGGLDAVSMETMITRRRLSAGTGLPGELIRR